MIPFRPFEHQVVALKSCLKYMYFALFLEPGLGKTSIVIKLYQLLRKRKAVKGLLVVAPINPMYCTWPAEVKKWNCGTGMRVSILHGPKKLDNLYTPADIYLINYEGLDWLFNIALKRKVNYPFDMIVCDESGKFRNPSSVRRKFVEAKLHKFKRRYILNGTPAPNSTMDLWGQILVLDGGKLLGRGIGEFRDSYCKKGGYKGKEWFVKEEKKKEIWNKIAPISLVVETKDARDMPPLHFVEHGLVMPPKVKKRYDIAKEDLWIELDQEDHEIKSDGAAVITCRQIASGAVYHPQPELGKAIPTDKREWDRLHDEKINVTLDLIDELQRKPLLIAYTFHHTKIRLETTLKKHLRKSSIPVIGRGTTPAMVQKYEVAWNKKQLPVMLINSQSGAHGLNLQKGGNHLLWFDPTWSLEDFIQLYRRLWREGIEGAVTVHSLIMEGTIDEIMLARTDEKNDEQQDLKTALKAHRKKLQATR